MCYYNYSNCKASQVKIATKKRLGKHANPSLFCFATHLNISQLSKLL